jgi:hypothetical protein
MCAPIPCQRGKYLAERPCAPEIACGPFRVVRVGGDAGLDARFLGVGEQSHVAVGFGHESVYCLPCLGLIIDTGDLMFKLCDGRSSQVYDHDRGAAVDRIIGHRRSG